MAALSLFCVINAGCMLGPDYQPPAVPLEEAWIYSGDQSIDTRQAVDPLWWSNAFSDPLLDELVIAALDQNLQLRSATLRMLQAQQQLAIAIGNQFPQQQQLSGSVSRAKGAIVPELITEQYEVGFNLGWQLDMWGRLRREVLSAAASLDATVAEYDGVLVSLVAQVARAYILIRTTQQRLEVAYNNIDYQAESLRIARAKFDAGEKSALDMEQAATLLNNTRASVPALESELQQLKNGLAVLLGQPPHNLDHRLGTFGDIPSAPASVAVGMPQDLLRQRPDVRASERVLAAQGEQIGVARAELYPEFSIGGSIGSKSSEVGNLFEGPSETWDLFGAFQWNLFNYGRLRSNVRLQDARFQQLLADYRETVLQAQAEVENAIVAYLKSQEQLALYEQAAQSSQESVRISTAQYRNGQIDFNTVLSTLTADLQQQDLVAIARGDVATSLVQVYLALGGGWEIREGRGPVELLPEEVKEEMRQRTHYWDRIIP